MDPIEHIYTDKHWARQQIKLLCTGEWTDAVRKYFWGSRYTLEYYGEHKDDFRHWKIDGIHQHSFGAGHNSNCPNCLIEYAKRKISTDNKMTWKLIQLAENGVLRKENND